MHDLLHDPLIGLRTRSGEVGASLPELLARLCADDVEGYTGLRPHQADPWHVFLVQIAASVLARRRDIDAAKPPADADFWREGLLDLSEGQSSAWELVVDDFTKPAFMQHPLAGGVDELRNFFEKKAAAPDELDVLITAKDHDLKLARANPGAAEAWLFSLITSQTTSGYIGKGCYGTVRMNSGSGSRPVVSMVFSIVPADRFLEELVLVCSLRSERIQSHGFVDRGLVLCWIRPWRRDDSMCAVTDLEPWFVEAVRPIRLLCGTRGLLAMRASSQARLVGPKILDSGVVGDPWIPINVENKKKGETALTLGAAGWTPERLVDLLFEQGFRLTPLQKPRRDTSDLWFIGSAIVRGQGTTDGFHAFRLQVPAKIRATLFNAEAAQSLGSFARELLKLSADASAALRTALMSMAEGGPEKVNFEKKAIASWAKAASADVTRRWHDRYFPTLWRATDPADRDGVKAAWKAELVADVRQALAHAERRLPIPTARRWRAVTKARWALDASLRKAALLPERTGPPEPEEVEEQSQ